MIAKSFIPKSTPIVVSELIFFFLGSSFLLSTKIEMKYLFVTDFKRVTLLISPLKSLLKSILTSFSFGSRTILVSKSTLIPDGNIKDCLEYLFLNLGNEALPLKKFP